MKSFGWWWVVLLFVGQAGLGQWREIKRVVRLNPEVSVVRTVSQSLDVPVGQGWLGDPEDR